MAVKQPGREHFDWATYTEKPRWVSYWHQLDEILAVQPDTVLVIGDGDGTVADVLRRRGVTVTTCDIVDDLHPDVVADVRDLPLADKDYDVTVCCQVLEHVEFETVPKALDQLARVTRKRVVISVPDRDRFIDIELGLGRGRRFFRRVAVPKNEGWVFNGVHYWELGTTQTPVSALRAALAERFSIVKEFRVKENAYHRFFVLTPR